MADLNPNSDVTSDLAATAEARVVAGHGSKFPVREAGGDGFANPVKHHIAQLDGWRGISIICVLAAHMLPLGPKAWHLNGVAGLAGMALFFTLSGYLITSFLLTRPEPRAFLVRRLCRILPLAYAYLAMVLTIEGATVDKWVANLLFEINYITDDMAYCAGTFWSLCVEMHFYLAVAVLVAVGGRGALWVLPALCIVVTITRITAAAEASINTHLRVDEILAGACLALVTQTGRLPYGFRWGASIPTPVLVALLAVTCHPLCGPALYARPYAAAMLVGNTLLRTNGWVVRGLTHPALKYLATVSYALYVIHPITYTGWMNEGSALTRYLVKRPFSFAVLFLTAHLSTKYWEAPWTALGKRLTARQRVG